MSPLSEANRYKFILFISGMSVKSSHAIENLRRICDQYLTDNFDLQIIDISKDPQMAVEYQIIGVPSLIKTAPIPSRMILGDLSNTEIVLKILDIGQ